MRERRQNYLITSLCLLLGVGVLFSLTGCAPLVSAITDPQRVPAGDPIAGRVALQTYGCHSCHTIPAVAGANSLVGPPLTAWAERSYIAGKLPNEPAHLVQWIRFPQAIEPGTAMPNLGVTEEDALHMAAYLYMLRRDQTWYVGAIHFLGLDR